MAWLRGLSHLWSSGGARADSPLDRDWRVDNLIVVHGVGHVTTVDAHVVGHVAVIVVAVEAEIVEVGHFVRCDFQIPETMLDQILRQRDLKCLI